MFHLQRYFSIASLLAFILVTVVLGMLYRAIALQMFIQLEQNKNVELTQSFANSLWPQLQPLITLTESSTHHDMRDLPIVDELRVAVIQQMRGLSVVKVKVYDLDGHTIFSTELDQIGENGSANVGFQGALRGEIASELTHRDTFSAFEGIIENQDVLSTYIPIHENGINSHVVGVFELYSNVTPFLWQITVTQRQLIAGVGITLALLYSLLLLIVRRADRILRYQQAEQLAAAEEIRRQQRTVALLQEREYLAREIHDSLGQVLGYVNTQAQAARSLLAKANTAATDQLLGRLVTVAQDAHVELRDFILKLQTGESSAEPPFVTRLQAHAAQIMQHSELTVILDGMEAWRSIPLPASVTDQLFRIVQEALNNIQKHAAAQQVVIALKRAENTLLLTVTDDGQGFDPQQVLNRPGHWGIGNMQKRASEIGGVLSVDSAPGAGVTVRVQCPLPDAAIAIPTPLLTALPVTVDMRTSGRTMLSAKPALPGALH
jgi:signal transduction histidine kinase